MTFDRSEFARPEAELNELYRELILDHYRNPQHRGHLTAPTACHEGLNPLCGDEVTVEVLINDNRIQDIAFTGSGCSISQSSASMMAEAVEGLSVDDALSLAADFVAMMSGRDENIDRNRLGDLEAMEGVRKFPVRVKCATLAWHVFEEVLEKDGA